MSSRRIPQAAAIAFNQNAGADPDGQPPGASAPIASSANRKKLSAFRSKVRRWLESDEARVLTNGQNIFVRELLDKANFDDESPHQPRTWYSLVALRSGSYPSRRRASKRLCELGILSRVQPFNGQTIQRDGEIVGGPFIVRTDESGRAKEWKQYIHTFAGPERFDFTPALKKSRGRRDAVPRNAGATAPTLTLIPSREAAAFVGLRLRIPTFLHDELKAVAVSDGIEFRAGGETIELESALLAWYQNLDDDCLSEEIWPHDEWVRERWREAVGNADDSSVESAAAVSPAVRS